MPTTGDRAATNPTPLFPDLTDAQANGLACVVCPEDYTTSTAPHVPIGRSVATGSQVFACAQPCAPLVGYTPPADAAVVSVP